MRGSSWAGTVSSGDRQHCPNLGQGSAGLAALQGTSHGIHLHSSSRWTQGGGGYVSFFRVWTKVTKQRGGWNLAPVLLRANLAPPANPVPISTEQWQGDGGGVGAEQGVAWGRVEGAGVGGGGLLLLLLPWASVAGRKGA